MEIIYLNFSPDNICVKLDNNTTKYMLYSLDIAKSYENYN